MDAFETYKLWKNAQVESFVSMIIEDKKRSRIIVKFSNGHTRIVKTQKGDHYDKYVGVSLAVTKELCGSTTKLYKLVDDKIALGNKVLVKQKNNCGQKNKKEKK